MYSLVTDLDAFATERSKVQADREEGLYRSALNALRRYGEKGWYDALVERASRVLREQYHEDTGRWTSKEMRAEQDKFRKAARASLAKTKKPTPESIESSARSIAASLSTGAVNAALEAAGMGDDRSLAKSWVSREDEKVRPSHAAAHGQTVPVGEKFSVGGSEMERPGDMRAPIGEWANCRCLLALVELSVAAAANTRVTAAAEHEAQQSVGVFLVPAEGESVHDISSEDVAHVTTIWLGTNEQRDEAGVTLALPDIKDDVQAVAEALAPFSAAVTERGLLGDDDADVLFIDPADVRHVREALVEHETILDAMQAVEQYPEWTPHLTLGYPEAPAADGEVPQSIQFDRLALWVGDSHYEYPLGGDMAEDQTADEPQVPPQERRLDYVDEAIPCWGVLAPEGVESGDGRMFSEGALRSRPLPLPLAYQKVNEPGHDGSFRVANIERTWRRDGKTYGMGHFLTSIPEVDEVIGVMAESGGRMGVSIDADDGSMEMHLRSSGKSLDEALAELAEDSEGIDMDDIITVFTSARICGATLCNIPAFHEAFIALGDVPEEFAPVDGEDLAIESRNDALAASVETFVDAAPGRTEDGPGWLTNPVDTDRLRDYWTRGEGAAKIGWGSPGDFNRCRTNLAQYVKPQYLSGYCANRHYDALGFWPGQHHALEALAASAEAARAVGKEFDDDATVGPGISLVASANLQRPPADWFADPGLIEPSRIVVTEEGRVFGHLAAWGTCHIGISGQCVTPPESPTDYAYFRTGSIVTDDGNQIAVGQITMDTGHADVSMRAKPAIAHYDNTGTVVCDVAVGQDDIGIWIAGAIRPETPPEKVEALRRGGSLSGDWRNIGGHLELVAALAVNVPGFPIPHVALAASGVEQQSLVAAGVVVQQDSGVTGNLTVEQIAAAVFTKMTQHLAAKKRIEELRLSVEETRNADARERMRRLAATRR